MVQMTVAFVAALIAFCICDFAWLGFVAKDLPGPDRCFWRDVPRSSIRYMRPS